RRLLRAGGVVDAVLEQQVREVPRGRARDGGERAELHEERAVAVEDDHPTIGRAQGEAEAQRGGAAHEADAAHREVVGGDRAPRGGGGHGGHADRGPTRGRDEGQDLLRLHHHAVSRPTSTAAGPFRSPVFPEYSGISFTSSGPSMRACGMLNTSSSGSAKRTMECRESFGSLSFSRLSSPIM